MRLEAVSVEFGALEGARDHVRLPSEVRNQHHLRRALDVQFRHGDQQRVHHVVHRVVVVVVQDHPVRR